MDSDASATVLIYHRVARLERDPQLLCVSPDHFEQQLDALRRRYQPVALARLVADARRGCIPDRAAAVTFDDGYADNLTAAAPRLAKFNVPATVFVTTHGDAPDRELWWDELERLVLGSSALPERVELEVDGERWTWELEAASRGSAADGWSVLQPPRTAHQVMYVELHSRLRRLPAQRRWAMLDQLARLIDGGTEARSSHRLLTPREITELAGTGLIDIGAHTVTHPVLADLSVDEQRREISQSRRELESILGRPVRAFSYPYGGRRDYSATTVNIVRSLGFDFACANQPAVMTTRTDLFQIPRLLVRDWDGDEFIKQIDRAVAPCMAGV